MEKNINVGIEEAQNMAMNSEIGSRQPVGKSAYLIPAIALCWSLFQLSLPSFITLTAIHIRTIHLAFAICLVFLSYPTLKKIAPNSPFQFLSTKDHFSWFDYLLAFTAPLCALYLSLDYLAISERQGSPVMRDLVIGITLIVLLLEAARRALGPALTIVASIFIIYSFFGPYMPSVIAFKGVSLERFLGQITMSSEGIYGVPLDVSANIVFLFVLFGALLEKAGGGEYFVQMAYGALGKFRGGPAKASVFASAMTGMISGSSIANTVTTGTFTIPLMKRVGYPDHKAAAVEVASSTNGQLTPPIMGAAAFIIAEYTNLNYFEVVVAAAIPALVAYIGLVYITHLEALKLGLKGIPKSELPNVWETFKGGIHYLIPLVVLIYELMVLRHSPELASFRAILILFVIMLLQHPVKAILGMKHHGQDALAGVAGIKQGFYDIIEGLIKGARNMVGIGVATASAGIIVGVVTMGLGGLINDVIELLSGGNIILLLIITAIASLILGMGLPTTANYIVMASLTAPVIVMVGGDNGLIVPLIAAHLFVFYFGILADDTPPVGLAAFAASAIAQSDPIKTGLQGFMYDIRTAILPFMFIFNTEILLIGVDTWTHGLFIFAMCTLGMLAFTSASQNFFLVKNRIWETLLFLLVALLFMRPELGSWNLDYYFPADEKTKIMNSIYDQTEPILKDFEERSTELSSIQPTLESLVPLLSEEEKQELMKAVNIPELTASEFQKMFFQMEFDVKKVQLMLETLHDFGTHPYWFYAVAFLLYLGLYAVQKSREKRIGPA